MPLIAGVHLRVAGEMRKPGDPVPEFETDPARRRRLSAYLEDGRVRRVDDDGKPVDQAAASPLDEAVREVADKLAESPNADYDLRVERAAEKHSVPADEIRERVSRPQAEGDASADLSDMGARDIVAGLEDGSLDPDRVREYEEGRSNGPRKTVADALDALASS